MSKVKTITATATEQSITFDATYQFVWFRSLGDGDALVSDHSGIIEGADDVALVKAGGSTRITVPYNKTVYVKAVSDSVDMEIHAQNFSDVPFKSRAKGGGQSITVEPLTVNDNGVYTAPTGKAYSPVTVDVQEEPWQPLQDGYSNFWFELTDDTLSPWLNFSAKNNDAVIDWGDGSGEVALDTLTPTHTYSKAGKYVVKVKGVTGITTQINTASNATYVDVLHHVELNNEITAIANYSFQYTAIEELSIPSSVNTIGLAILRACGLLKKVESASNASLVGMCAYCTFLRDVEITGTPTTIGNNSFYQCVALKEITLPSSIEDIGASVFNSCIFLNTIHIQATTPPTLGANVFTSLPSDFIIYVPVGTAETYKAASGWSTYADHILEEGQTPTRAMVAKFNAMKKEVTDDGSDSNENR